MSSFWGAVENRAKIMKDVSAPAGPSAACAYKNVISPEMV